jgi:hypothetical protein
MDRKMEKLYLKEVYELTDLLRTEWLDIKNKLLENNINADFAYMFGYIEDENDGLRIGLIYTKENGFQKFILQKDKMEIVHVKTEEIKKEFPQVIVLDKIKI